MISFKRHILSSKKKDIIKILKNTTNIPLTITCQLWNMIGLLCNLNLCTLGITNFDTLCNSCFATYQVNVLALT